MTYDLAQYRHSVKPIVKEWCDARLPDSPLLSIGPLALNTTCDIVIIAYYVGELYGFTPELNARIAGLVAFYKPDEILNKLEGGTTNGI